MSSQILSNPLRWLAAVAIGLGLAGCGGGGSMSGPSMGPQACSAMDCGNAMVTLTDATGDFTSYTVDITSLTLTKANGTIVETLPAKTRVDLTQLVNLTELLTAASVPQGEYTAVNLAVDYSSAAVFVDINGTPTQATLQDSSKNPLTTLNLSVQLDNKHHLVITPGKIARLALDFNLAASNTVDTTQTPPVVTVNPFLVASVVPSDTKSIRVRGALASVDTANSNYTVNVEPFEDEHEDRGQVVVHTTDQTTYEIDGTPYTGAGGLTALAAEPAGTMTVAFGTLSTTDHSFTASQVLAGTSVQSATLDRLRGNVISRSGDTLVVRSGTIWMHEDDEDHFSARDVTLSIGDGTKFTVAGNPSATPDKSWPSVGSRITAFGTAGTDTSGNKTFDATAGRVRLEVTSLWGTATGTSVGQVTLNLQAIDGNQVSVFNFAGTGQTSGQDANPASYVVDTGGLPLAMVSTSAPLRFFGLVQPFGQAPPDFNAQTLVNFVDTSAFLNAQYGMGSTVAFASVDPTGLMLNVSDPALMDAHIIRIGPQVIDLTKLATNLAMVPAADGSGSYAIRTEAMSDMDMIDSFNNYADFETELAAKLGGGSKVLRVVGIGSYDANSNTFTIRNLAVILG